MISDAADSFDPVHASVDGEVVEPGAEPGGGSVVEAEQGVETQGSEQSELDLGVVSTGSPEVDRSLRPLDTITDRPVSEHPEIFDQVLVDLTEAMNSSDRQDIASVVPPAAG